MTPGRLRREYHHESCHVSIAQHPRTPAAQRAGRDLANALAEGTVHVGNNPFTISLHEEQANSEFASVDDAQIRVIPFMTSMGHGSAGNIDPEFRVHGEYDGSFNLSMGGGWDVRFEVRRGGNLIGTVSYGFRP